MKFIASSTALSGHLQAISRVINAKNALPILDNFLFKIEGLKLTVTASDTETRMVTVIDLVDADSDGAFAISAKSMMDSLKEISEQPIHFDWNPSSMEIKIFYQNGQFNFMTANADEYPEMKKIEEKTGDLTISATALQKGISTIFASADDEIRPIMNGVVMDLSGKNVTFVASDAHKLVRLINSSYHGNMGEEEHSVLIIPKKPANLLKAVLPKESGDVQIVFNDSNALFQTSDYTLFCRLIDGRFPNYNAVIPQDNPYSIWIDRISLLNALKRVSICSDQSNGLIKMEIANNIMKISAQNLDFSTSADESVPCQYEDEPILIGFKAIFLMDILSNISTTEVVLKLGDSARAGLVLPSENEKDEDLLMLLMPMMINK